MMTMTIHEPAIEDPQADLRRIWLCGYNCGEGRLHEIDPGDTAALHYEQQRRERRMRMYAMLVIRDLDADPDRLTRVAALARTDLEAKVAAGRDPNSDHSLAYARGAKLADLALILVRQAGAEDDLSRREWLLKRVNDSDPWDQLNFAVRKRSPLGRLRRSLRRLKKLLAEVTSTRPKASS